MTLKCPNQIWTNRWQLSRQLTLSKDKPKGESPEVTDTLVPPPEASVITPVMDNTKLENTMEANDRGLMDHEQRLQREEEQYAIYISILSEEEESDTNTDTDETSYPFLNLR